MPARSWMEVRREGRGIEAALASDWCEWLCVFSAGEEVGKVEAKKPEPDFSLLSNPARVLPTQVHNVIRHVSYIPPLGAIMLPNLVRFCWTIMEKWSQKCFHTHLYL